MGKVVVKSIVHQLVISNLVLSLVKLHHRMWLNQTQCRYDYQGISCNLFSLFIQLNHYKFLVGTIVDMLILWDKMLLKDMVGKRFIRDQG